MYSVGSCEFVLYGKSYRRMVVCAFLRSDGLVVWSSCGYSCGIYVADGSSYC